VKVLHIFLAEQLVLYWQIISTKGFMSKLVPCRKIPSKKSGIIREFHGDINFIARLREMGFGEGTTITKFSEDAQICIIINVKGKKIFLSEIAAECIFVELT
jgi:Fe2+ transport system protein FeoA